MKSGYLITHMKPMSSNNPLCSILICFYRVEGFIERCAKSVLGQSYPNIEYVFIDDCSPDNSLAILESTISQFPLRSSQIKILRNNANLGIASSRNKAVDNCTGEFILWVDADDYISVDAVSHLISLQLQTNADIISAKFIEVGNDGQRERSLCQVKTRQEMLIGLLNFSILPMLWGRLIRTSLYRDNHIKALDGINYREDSQVISRLVYYSNRIATLDEVIYYYDRTNECSYMKMGWQKIEHKIEKDKQDLIAVSSICSFFKDKAPSYRQPAEESVVYHLRELLRDTARSGDKNLFMETAASLSQIEFTYVKKYGKSVYFLCKICPLALWWIKRIRVRLLEHNQS